MDKIFRTAKHLIDNMILSQVTIEGLCSSCKKSMDRDIVAAMNISYKGLQKFCNPSGLSEKAMKRNLDYVMPIILRVDGSKLGLKARGYQLDRTSYVVISNSISLECTVSSNGSA
ncbi:MAG: hypothetical protein ACYDAJ_01355 [Nitrosotalea sp.]